MPSQGLLTAHIANLSFRFLQALCSSDLAAAQPAVLVLALAWFLGRRVVS